jgi:hypothetical protein
MPRRLPDPPLSPTRRFICDWCKGEIEDASTAWGQWYVDVSDIRPDVQRCWGFSIVHGEAHPPRCTLVTSAGQAVGDYPLSFLQTADGFTYLLEFFVSRDVDADELCRFLMRLFVPGYENAFRYVSQALSEGLYELRGNRVFLTQSEIQQIVDARAEGRLEEWN